MLYGGVPGRETQWGGASGGGMKEICERPMDSRLTGRTLLTARVESVNLAWLAGAGFFSAAPGSGLHGCASVSFA